MPGDDLQGAQIASPKLTPSDSHGWYGYYAGYSASFASDAIDVLVSDDSPKRILDPWNGSGTTTLAATLMGHRPIGMDRNPALVVIAKGRHLPVSVRQSIVPLANDITTVAERLLQEASLRSRPKDALTIPSSLESVFPPAGSHVS